MRIERQRAMVAVLLTVVMVFGVTAGAGQAQQPAPWSGMAANAGPRAFLPLVVGQPAASFTDDFEQGAGNWTPYTNWPRLEPQQWYWHPGGGYQGSAGYTFDHRRGQKTPEDALTLYLGPGSEGWGDYRSQVRFKVQDGIKAGMWMRGTYRDEGAPGQWFTGYYCMVTVSASGGDDVQLMQMRTTGERGDPPEIFDEYLYHFANPYLLAEQRLVADLTFDTWHQLTVEVRGPNIKCLVDGEPAIDYTDTFGSVFLNGTIGLYTYGGRGFNAVMSFDDVQVEPLN